MSVVIRRRRLLPAAAGLLGALVWGAAALAAGPDAVSAPPSPLAQCLWDAMPREALLSTAGRDGAIVAALSIKETNEQLVAATQRCAPGAEMNAVLSVMAAYELRRSWLEELRVMHGIPEQRLLNAWRGLAPDDRALIIADVSGHHPDGAGAERVRRALDALCLSAAGSSGAARLAIIGWIVAGVELDAAEHRLAAKSAA